MNRVMIKRNLVSDLRNPASYLYYLVLPISLMFLLGAILQGSFGSQATTPEKVRVQVVIQRPHSEKGRLVKQTLQHTKMAGLSFTQRSSVAQAKQRVRQQKNAAAVIVGQRVQVLTATGLTDYQVALLKGVLVEVFQNVALTQTALTFNGRVLPPSQLKKTVVVQDRQGLKPAASSYQYYAIAMTGMFILYFAEIGIDTFAQGRRKRTLPRELIAPISRQQIINSTVLGHAIFGGLTVLVSMVLTQVLFKVPWQQAFGFSFLNIVSLMLLFLVLGFFLETVGQGVGVGITQVIIQLAAFLGGGYFPVSDGMLRFSPLGWVMSPLRSALWTENPLNWSGVGLNLGLAVGLFVAMSVILNKREVF